MGSTILNSPKLKKEVPLYAERIFLFGLQITDAVNYLIENSVAHDDLHTGNIIVNNLLKPKIIDFDKCKHIDKSNPKSQTEDSPRMALILMALIHQSPDIAEGAKDFLISCLDIWKDDSESDLTLMESFMRACIDHLKEIRSNPTQLRSRLFRSRL